MFGGTQIHTSKMTLADDVNLEEFVMTKDEFSGADIKAICTEAGLLALRERRMKVHNHSYQLLRLVNKFNCKLVSGVDYSPFILLFQIIGYTYGL